MEEFMCVDGRYLVYFLTSEHTASHTQAPAIHRRQYP